MKTPGRRRQAGFTLVELLVVVLIIGILSAIMIPGYNKTVETSKADDAASVVAMLGNANKMFRLDNTNYVSAGALSDACNSGSCGGTATCDLVRCGYVGKRQWTGLAYNFQVGPAVSCGLGGSGIACARRASGAQAPYSGWGYVMSNQGVITPYGGAPDPLK